MEHSNPRWAEAFADLIIRHHKRVLVALLCLTALATWATTKLTINSNQLELISQELPEVKEVKRVIDMVGGSGFLVLALRSKEVELIKKVADDVAHILEEDTAHVRKVTYRQPVEFIQENMVLFVKTEDLLEIKKRANAVIRDHMRRANPFFLELRKTEPKKFEFDDMLKKYGSVGKKSILDDYYISDDRVMALLLIKPMWDQNDLAKTKTFLDNLNQKLVSYSQNNPHQAHLVEDYDLIGENGTVAYGYTGTYKTSLDDSYAIAESLEPVTVLALVSIFLIVWFFFRKFWPSLIVMTGVTIGTILTMGFAYVTVGELNMVTSILAGLLLGFGVDYGIHLTFRTRIELGQGKSYDIALRDAILNAGRPALISAIVTGGAFLMLLVSEFKGFSQFGFLAGLGTIILALTMYLWCGAIIAALGKFNPSLPSRWIGRMELPKVGSEAAELRIPRPGTFLLVSSLIIALISLFAMPFTSDTPPTRSLSIAERMKYGVRFNYNSRALMPEKQHSVQLQDEINRRFQISSDPSGIYAKDLEGTKEIYDEITQHPEKYPSIDQVVSIYSFVPPKEIAEKNAAILAQWKEELKELDLSVLPEEQQKYVPLFKKILEAKPFDVDQVPEIFAKQFRHLPQAKPENHGYLTWIYPKVDLWDGKQMLQFTDETQSIKAASGNSYRTAGSPILYARLARIVLWDGKLTLILTAIWILVMHYLDFRSVRLALASVLPLGVGLAMMLGFMTMMDERLNFMNIIMLPILLGFGVSHGLYLLHRFLEGTSPLVALRSVGAAVSSSTLTTVAGFASLFIASHQGLKSMGVVSCLGLLTTLVVSFTVLAAVLQILHDQRRAKAVKSDAEKKANSTDEYPASPAAS